MVPGVPLGHAKALLMANTKYLVDQAGMKVFSIPTSSHVSNQENLFLGQVCKLAVIGFVDNDTFSGNYVKKLYNFKHYDISFVALYVDGEQKQTKLLQPDFENGCCVRLYMKLIQTISCHMKDHSLLVDREEFIQGYTLFTIDLSPDKECSDHYSQLKQET